MCSNYFFEVNENVKNLIKICMSELIKLNVPFSNSIYFREGGGTNTYGLCYLGKDYIKYKNYEYVISINKFLNTVRDIKETIIHELLHTVDFPSGHGGRWKKWARIINENTDYNITRISNLKLKDGAFYGQKKNEVYDPAKFISVQCPHCGNSITLRKTTSISKHGKTDYICSKCNMFYYKFIPNSIIKYFTDEQKKKFIDNLINNFKLSNCDAVINMLPFLNQSLRDYLLLQLFIKQPALCVSNKGHLFIDPIRATCSKKAKDALADMYINGDIEYLKNITEDEFIYFSFYFSLTHNYIRVQDHWVSLGHRRI